MKIFGGTASDLQRGHELEGGLSKDLKAEVKAAQDYGTMVEAFTGLNGKQQQHILSQLSPGIRENFEADIARANGRSPENEKVGGVGAEQEVGLGQQPRKDNSHVKLTEQIRGAFETTAVTMGMDPDVAKGATLDQLLEGMKDIQNLQNVAAGINVDEFACLKCAEANMTGQFDNGLHTNAQRGTDDLFLTGQV